MMLDHLFLSSVLEQLPLSQSRPWEGAEIAKSGTLTKLPSADCRVSRLEDDESFSKQAKVKFYRLALRRGLCTIIAQYFPLPTRSVIAAATMLEITRMFSIASWSNEKLS